MELLYAQAPGNAGESASKEDLVRHAWSPRLSSREIANGATQGASEKDSSLVEPGAPVMHPNILEQGASPAARNWNQPAPVGILSRGERIWDATTNGMADGFQRSLEFNNLGLNLTLGAGFGAYTRAVLPLTGPVGKVTSAVVSAYFVGKPLIESTVLALNAKSQGEMENAAHHLGDALGGMPVAFFEGMVGAKLGSAVTGKILPTRFVDWKARQYEKLDNMLGRNVSGSKPETVEYNNAFYDGKSLRGSLGNSEIFRPEIKFSSRHVTRSSDTVPLIGIPDTDRRK